MPFQAKTGDQRLWLTFGDILFQRMRKRKNNLPFGREATQ